MVLGLQRWTDEQLLATELRISDPLAIEGLVKSKPDPNLPPEILGEYNVTPPGGKAAVAETSMVWCCHCQGSRHWKGFVVTNESGDRHLLGSQCGPKYYGLSFTSAQNAFKTATRRTNVLSRLLAIDAASTSIRAAADAVLFSDSLTRLDRKRDELRTRAPGAFARLAAAVLNGSPLDEEVQVRDLDAERRRDERSSAKAESPIYTTERRSLGHVDGAALLRTSDDSRASLIELKRMLAAIEETARSGTDTATGDKLKHVVTASEKAAAHAVDRVNEARSAHLFFGPSNLARLERWSASLGLFSLDADDGALRVKSKHEGEHIIAPLEALSPPPFRGLAV